MRTLLIFILLTTKLFGQALTEKEITKYVKTIDSLHKAKSLKHYDYVNMSRCGGGLSGYYYKGKLVYIDAIYGAELGYSEREMYFKDTIIYKIIYNEHFPEWDKYAMNYPNLKDTLDKAKMTYTDSTFTILLSKPITFTKTSQHKVVSKIVDKEQVNNLLKCGRQMKLELETEKKEIR